MDEYNFDAILTYLALDTFNASFLTKLGQSKFPLELSKVSAFQYFQYFDFPFSQIRFKR